MGNKKQDGSNVRNVEGYTGRCPVHCEQCFANFGMNGTSVPASIYAAKNRKWFDYAKEHGWRPSSTKGKSAYLIPTTPTQAWTRRQQKIKVAGGRMLPCFLRVSSMSDSSFSERAWCAQVREAWGDYCFFNTSIRALLPHELGGRGRRGNLDEYHKLVVTTNPGHQLVAFPPKGASLRAKLELSDKLMQPRGPADFLSPMFLSDLGLGQLESVIKFYRLRAFPTIVARTRTDKPVVVTVMRFKSVEAACGWAVKYGAECVVESASPKNLKIAEHYRCSATKLKPKSRTRILLRIADPAVNESEYLREWTELSLVQSFWRAEKTQLAHFPWVCDRSGQSCKGCGLCATLDGAYPDNANPLSPIAPEPYAEGYVGWEGIRGNPEGPGDWFESYLSQVVRSNPPGEAIEVDEESMAMAVEDLSGYVSQGGEGEDGHYCDGWNTHEHALTLLAFIYWCGLRKGARTGMSREKAIETTERFVTEVAGSQMLEGLESDLREMWDGTSDWNEEFGPVG